MNLHAEVKGTLKVRVESLTPIVAPAAAPTDARAEDGRRPRTEKRGRHAEGESAGKADVAEAKPKGEKHAKAEKAEAVEAKPKAEKHAKVEKAEKAPKAPKAEKKEKKTE